MERFRVAIRRLALGGSGLTFGAIAILSLVAPRAVALRYAYTLSGADAWNQFHAVFTGFWLGLAAMMLTASLRPYERLLGDLCGIAIGLQAFARLVSVVAHGVPNVNFLYAMLGEAATAMLVLQARALVKPR